MLDGNPPISRSEHRWFFAATFAGLAIWLVSFTIPVLFPPPPPPDGIKISFGIYSIFDIPDLVSPLYSVVAFAICVPLAWRLDPAKLIFSLLPLALLTYFFDNWFVDSQYRIREAAVVAPDHEFKTWDFILLSGSIFDVLTFLLVNVVIGWQIKLLYRLLAFAK